MLVSFKPARAVTKALIGGGGGYSYIRVLPDEFRLKSVAITVDFKRNSSGRTRIYEYAPPPPINALVTALKPAAHRESIELTITHRHWCTHPKMPQACCKLSILLDCCSLSTTCNKLLNFIWLKSGLFQLNICGHLTTS